MEGAHDECCLQIGLANGTSIYLDFLSPRNSVLVGRDDRVNGKLAEMKHENWRAFPRFFAPNTAPMLVPAGNVGW